MAFKNYDIRWSVVVCVALAIGMLFIIAMSRLSLDFDITASLPQSDPVLSDARYIIQNHPIQDRIVIDVGHNGQDIGCLVEAGALVEKRLRESGLFRKVGFSEEQQAMPPLIADIAGRLPMLFSEKELREKIEPLLSPDRVREALRRNISQLAGLEGVGQSALMAKDPLGFRNILLQRMSYLAPSDQIDFHQGHMVSRDRRHLLLIAEPATPAADTVYARKVEKLIQGIAQELVKSFSGRDSFALTTAGAYRAALDNETSAKRDTRQAVIFSTVAIAVLLLLGFPRPLIGLLALLPAFAGTVMALFVYSLFSKSISMLAVGFGGAIISFTVDYGIAYLLFLDRPHETYGLEATKEVWSLGILAMLTTAVSFAFLFAGGFPALSQLGCFSALGVVFTYVFVHAIYPFIFPRVPPAKRESFLPLQRFVNSISSSGPGAKALAALGLAFIMLFFARPDIRIDLRSMNTVSRETADAERQIRSVWGDVMSRVFVVLEGKSRDDLMNKGDRLADLLEPEEARDVLKPVFLPAVLYPGEERSRRNFAAWKSFWTVQRVSGLKKTVHDVSREVGFAPDAFHEFFSLVEAGQYTSAPLPDSLCGIMGITEKKGGGGWSLFAAVVPGSGYKPEAFFNKITSALPVRIFDPSFFGDRLGAFIFSGFVKVAAIVGIVTVLVAFLYLLDWRLTLISMAPTIFALVCTLGTLNLLGQPLGIPVIMVSVVVIGMGTDYALYLVRSYQRYMDERHPSQGLIRMSIFLSFATTFLGFGVLALSGHSLLKSTGLGLALGIGYSYLGAVTIVPPLLARIFRPFSLPEEKVEAGSKRHTQRTLARYRSMDAYVRLFARFKILLDPMFPRLAGFVKAPRTIVDIGCGYGIPAAWLLEIHPQARVHAFDPDSRRVLFASRALGGRGSVQEAGAPHLDVLPPHADTVMLIDVIHMLSDEDLQKTLQKLSERLDGNSTVIIRALLPSSQNSRRERRMEELLLGMRGRSPRFRTKEELTSLLSGCGLETVLVEPSGSGRAGTWFIAKKKTG